LENATFHRLTFNDSLHKELAHFSSNWRILIKHNILVPFIEAVDSTNEILARSHNQSTTAHPLTIGSSKSSVQVLEMALQQNPQLCGTRLPFLLPFLRIHPNQEYLVERVRKFIQVPTLNEFPKKSNGSSDFIASKDIKKWQQSVLSDAELIFFMFAVYLDLCLTVNSMTKQPDKPFSSIYVLKEGTEPSAVQKLPNAFFIYVRNKDQPQFELVINGEAEDNADDKGVSVYRDVYTAPTSSDNHRTSPDFAFMLLFLHCRQRNQNYLGDIRLDHTGLNMNRLFRSG